MFVGSSITHTTCWSRTALVQYPHGSTSVMLLHTEHNRSFSRSSSTAAASARASASLARSTWNASRCADFVPIPGSFLNSSISRDIGSANRAIARLFHPRQLQPAHHPNHIRLHRLFRPAPRLIERRRNQVLQQLNVPRTRSQRRRLNLHPQHL